MTEPLLNVPKAIGPYVSCVRVGDFIFTSGQIPVEPESGEMQKDITAQTRQSLLNIKAVLATEGASVADIVKTTVFVTDLAQFGTVNAAYETFFKENKAPFPARSCVEVSRLPKGADIEIEAVAYLK